MRAARRRSAVETDYPFSVRVIESCGGVSAGRNDAARALPADVEVIAFPNDTSIYPPGTLRAAAAQFASPREPDAISGTLVEGGQIRRHPLPPDGVHLDPTSIWWAIEPAVFIRRDIFDQLGGLRADIGTGAPSPWQSGEGTEFLLRLLAQGGVIISAPGVKVLGPGDRHELSADDWIAKNRRYARGTGYVYRIHKYPLYPCLRTIVGPLVIATRHDPVLSVSLRLAAARSMGRIEGLLAHPLTSKHIVPKVKSEQ